MLQRFRRAAVPLLVGTAMLLNAGCAKKFGVEVNLPKLPKPREAGHCRVLTTFPDGDGGQVVVSSPFVYSRRDAELAVESMNSALAKGKAGGFPQTDCRPNAVIIEPGQPIPLLPPESPSPDWLPKKYSL